MSAPLSMLIVGAGFGRLGAAIRRRMPAIEGLQRFRGPVIGRVASEDFEFALA